MAKVLGVKALQAKTTIFLRDKLIDNKLTNDIGKFARDRIYSFTKSGKSLVTGAALKTLSTGYKKYRSKFEKANPGSVGKVFRPGKSNLTFTGQMLDALSYTARPIKKLIEVFVESTARQPLPSVKKGKPTINDPKSNAEVAREVSKKGRPFVGLDATGVKRIKQMIINDLRRKLKSNGLAK